MPWAWHPGFAGSRYTPARKSQEAYASLRAFRLQGRCRIGRADRRTGSSRFVGYADWTQLVLSNFLIVSARKFRAYRWVGTQLLQGVTRSQYSAVDFRSSGIVWMVDIEKLMEELARERPVFHSEADFQHALAWQIHRTNPGHAVRLEHKPRANSAMYVDIWMATVGVVVELKYRTRELDCEVQGEPFLLRDQAARPPSRYSFMRDIQRIEDFVSTVPDVRSGLAVMLTNDSLYWNRPSRRNLVDAEFHLHEGRRVGSEMAWSKRASDGTRKGREATILLTGAYHLQWRDYASVGAGRHARFRYLAIRVGDCT